jgi:hypothetical protein
MKVRSQVGVRMISPGTPATKGCALPTPVEDDDGCRAVGDENWQGKTCPSATWSTSTYYLVSSLSLRGGKLALIHLHQPKSAHFVQMSHTKRQQPLSKYTSCLCPVTCQYARPRNQVGVVAKPQALSQLFN